MRSADANYCIENGQTRSYCVAQGTIFNSLSIACDKPYGKRIFQKEDFPGGTGDKNIPVKAVDSGSIPCLGRFHMPQSH